MKLNKSKGKVHPSPSSSSSSSSSSNSTDSVSALNLLLPAAILTLISALSLQDREVLAYMITRSLKSTSISAAAAPLDHHRKQQKSKKSPLNHKSPSFDCGCFECYTSYWFRWDSSPHRELIHQAIEAFEEHLATTEQAKKSGGGRSRRREKERAPPPTEAAATVSRKSPVHPLMVVAEESAEEISPKSVPEIAPPTPEREDSAAESVAGEKATVAETEERENEEVEEMSGGHQQHKGLARKVLPDVIGLFNSRLWNLWGPNV